MTSRLWVLTIVFFAVLAALAIPLGRYLTRVFAGENAFGVRLAGPVERGIYRLSGVDPDRQHDWKQYAAAMLGSSPGE